MDLIIEIKNNPAFFIEATIITAIILWQTYYSFNLWKQINSFKETYNQPLFTIRKNVKRDDLEFFSSEEYQDINDIVDHSPDDKNVSAISLVESNGDNQLLSRIKHAINNYLVNNFGASVNFSLIRDIIDRETNTKDEEISQALPTPLYMGLAATMVGIILGLFAMPGLHSNPALSGGIQALIDGVKIAMIASLWGLFCTSVLSSFMYKKAKAKIEAEKNQQLSYLQAKLLPDLVRSEETGLSGLKASIDKFSRDVVGITEGLLNTVSGTQYNLEIQKEIIDKIENINVTRVSKANLELFDKMEKNMDSFNSFSQYLGLMGEIANNLQVFANKTNKVEELIENTNKSLSISQSLFEFLSTHFQNIDSVDVELKKTVAQTHHHFNESLEELRQGTQAKIEEYKKDSNHLEQDLSNLFVQINNNLQQTTSEHLNKLSKAYNEATPQFNKLNFLEELLPIKETLNNHSGENIQTHQQHQKELINYLDEIKNNLSEHSTDEKALIRIEKSLDKLASKWENHSGDQDSGKPAKRWIQNLEFTLKIAAYITIISGSGYFLFTNLIVQ